MLKALKDFGEFIGLERGFEAELKSVRSGNKIAITSIKEDSSFEVGEIIEFEEDKEYDHLFYYKGGNESVTGTTGIMGISPFFLNLSKLTEDKVDKSTAYDKLYKKNILYLFSMGVELEEDLNKGIVTKELRNAFKTSGFTFSNNVAVTKEKENEWLIADEEKFIVRKEDEKLNIYDFSNDHFVNDFLKYLKYHLEEIKALSVDWIYFYKFRDKDTEGLHKKFIEAYIRAERKNGLKRVKEKCKLCENISELCYPRLPFFALDVSNYNYNLTSNKLEDSRLKVCRECESFIAAGWKALNKLFGGRYYVLVPKLRDNASNDALEKFVRLVSSSNLSDFERLNNALGDGHLYEEIEFSFIVMRMQQQKAIIEKFVPNYKTFAIRFEDESLIQDDELEYVDWTSEKVVVRNINSFFELERLLRFFFVSDNNKFFSKYFYELYHHSKQKKVVPENMDSSFKHRLFIYRDNLFSFIYETNLSALNDKLLNDTCLNFLLYEIRKQRDFWGNKAETNVDFKIMESLNYYYFIKHKIIGEDIKMKEQISSLKAKFEKLEDKNAKQEAEKKIEEIVEEDDRLVYYLIGQFIRKIDNFRGKKGKNKIFDGFVQNINRKSIKQRFLEDILQKQNYYIEQLNPKAKFIFDVLANNLDKLFEYEPYEEMVISLITGYYSSDILKSPKVGGDVNVE